MKIEEAIRQEKFISSLQKAVINITYTGNWVRDQSTQFFKPYDLLPQHYNVLRILKGKHPKPVSPGDIKEVMLDKGTDVTRLLDKLEMKGFIARHLCAANRRKMEITLTADGLNFLQEIEPQMKEHGKRFSHLTEAEAEELSRLLDKFRG